MEFRHLRHFVALAEERSFTRAAEREHIVQSGLSTSIRALEKEVGAPLFVRGTRPVRLTAEGLAMLPAARLALEAAVNARQAVQDTQGVLAGELRIGALQTAGHTLPVSSWLATFAVDHPAVRIRVQQLPALAMVEMVADGHLDCALVSLVSDRVAGLEVVPLVAEPLVLACTPTHPLSSADAVKLTDLATERFVETPPQWAIRQLLDTAFDEAGIERDVVCEVNEWTMLLDLVSAGVGIALIPEGLALDTSAVRLVPLAGPDLVRRVDLILPTGPAASPAARRFREYVTHPETRRPG
ncbi:LysR family transcriptional regulator [Kribbella pittospori]|nr:LysR family transcriptional regulator [Kribbella pittospori]